MRTAALLLSVIAIQFTLKSATITLPAVSFGGESADLTGLAYYGGGAFTAGVQAAGQMNGNHGFSFHFVGSGSGVFVLGNWSGRHCNSECGSLSPTLAHDDLPEILLITGFSLPGEIRGYAPLSGDTYVIPLNTYKVESFTRSWTETDAPGTVTYFTENRYVFLAAPEPASWLLFACGAALLTAGRAKIKIR